MANTSIFAAFERMWQHIVALVGGKANAEHEHDNYIPVDEKGAPNGVATLNESGTIPSSQLPSYVDDVLEFAARASFPTTGESGKIYVDTTTNVTYRWSGSTYTEISKSLAIGTTDSTAAAGNHGHKLSDLENDSGFTTKQYVDEAVEGMTAPVTSVNGKIGEVILTASDVGALPSTTTIPTKVSDLTNDSEFATEQYVDDAIEDHNTSPLAHVNKMNSENPVGEGSFSMNRKSGSTIGIRSFAEGENTEASGDYSHAEGQNTIAEGKSAHAEGANTEVEGDYSHAEGEGTYAHGAYAHVEGQDNHAYGNYVHVEGRGNTTHEDYSHVQGKFSRSATNAAHVVGNGSEDQSSNAHVLDWDGNAWFAGDVYVGSESGTDRDDGSKKLATEEYVDNAIENLPTASTSKYGVTKLSSSTSDSSTTTAATPSAVKSAYDLANNAMPKAGGTMTGALTLAGDPTSDLEAATKQYVDASASNMFIAEYGVTTFAEIQEAYEAGKMLFCKKGGIAAPLTTASAGAVFVFSYVDYSAEYSRQRNLTIDFLSDNWYYETVKIDRKFIATYGETTLDEIASAIEQGYTVWCKYEDDLGDIYYGQLVWENTSTYFPYVFSVGLGSSIILLYMSEYDSWNKIDHVLVTVNSNRTLTGKLVAQSNTDYTTKQVRNIILVADGEEIPAGANGDICLVYAP